MTATDFLIDNGGRLDPSWFEPHYLPDLITAWLTAASGTDQAVEATVYARAYETLVDGIMSQPAQQRDRDKSSAFTDAQLRHWQAQAAYWRGKADALNGVGSPALVQWEGEPTWRN